MRIAINSLAMKSEFYGGGRYIKNLIRSLSNLDKANEYIIYASQSGYDEFGGLGENFQYEFAPGSRPLRLAWEQTFLPWDLKRKKVDLFHGPAFITPLWKSCCYVVTIFDLAYFLTPETDTLAKRVYFRTLMPRVAKKADSVIAISQNTKADICELLGVPKSKVAVTYLAADESFYPRTDSLEFRRVQQKYRLGNRYLLFVGLIEPRKNLKLLVEAFVRILGNHPEIKLIIGGDLAWGYDDLLGLVRHNHIQERVLFIGRIAPEDLPAVYSHAEAFVYPALLGGFGLPVLEAMACGTPVITARNSSFPEIVGDAGILVDTQRADELEEALSLVLTDKELRGRMKEKGLDRSRLFSWEKTARETLEVYRQISH